MYARQVVPGTASVTVDFAALGAVGVSSVEETATWLSFCSALRPVCQSNCGAGTAIRPPRTPMLVTPLSPQRDAPFCAAGAAFSPPGRQLVSEGTRDREFRDFTLIRGNPVKPPAGLAERPEKTRSPNRIGQPSEPAASARKKGGSAKPEPLTDTHANGLHRKARGRRSQALLPAPTRCSVVLPPKRHGVSSVTSEARFRQRLHQGSSIDKRLGCDQVRIAPMWRLLGESRTSCWRPGFETARPSRPACRLPQPPQRRLRRR